MSTMESPVRSLRRITNRLRRHSSDLHAVSTATAISKMAAVSEADPSDLLELSVCNLPEMLARDLDLSEAAFLGRNMTAGTPVRNLTPLDDYHQLYPTAGSSKDAMDLKDALSGRQPLSAIEEQLRQLDLDDNGGYLEETYFTSDSGSDSGMAEPPSIRMRQQSVVTAATSVNTHRYSNTSHCSSLKQQQPCSLTAFEGGNLDHLERSWFDLNVNDEDEDDDIAAKTEPHTMPNMSSPSLKPRPGPGPEAVQGLDGGCPNGSLNGSVSFAVETEAVRDRGTAFTPDQPSNAPPHEPASNNSQSYLQRKRAARQRRKDKDKDKDRYPAQLQINPLALNPSLFSRGHAFHNLSVGRSCGYPPNKAPPGSSTPQKRPHTSSGALSTEKPRLVDIPRPSISDGRSSLRSFSLQSPRSRDEQDHSRRSNRNTLNSTTSAKDFSLRPESYLVKSFRKTMNRMSGRTIIDATSSRIPAGDSDAEREVSRVDDTIDNIIDEYKDKWEATAAMSAAGGGNAGESSGGGHEADDEAGEDGEQQHDLTADHSVYFDPDVTISDTFRGWLGPSTTRHPSQPTTGPSAASFRPGLPLSAEVIENLRVSLSGFPDTMLLTSSLSIETIRAYAKKLKRHTRPENPFNQSALSPAAASTTSSSRWKRSLGRASKMAAASPLGPTPPPALTTTSAQPSAGPNWTCMKTIFPGASDYRCEALYAHLVAYNYIATTCGHGAAPTTTTSPPMRRPTGTMPAGSAQTPPAMPPRTNTDALLFPVVPKKAAHLLGIGAGSGSSVSLRSPSSTHVGKMKGLFGKGKGKEVEEDEEELKEALGGRAVDASLRPGNHEVALREVQIGLVRCVACLVHVLKKSGVASIARSEEGDDDDDGGVAVVDPFFFRALCELVRAEEEVAE